jgi:hypothetical protein
MDKAGRVGINPGSRRANAERSELYELDVLGRRHDYDGIIRCGGRQGWGPTGWGNALSDAPVTDGKWHNVTRDLSGCQAFEVVAGARDRTGNRVSLMHAVALSTFNQRNPWWLWLLRKRQGIRYTQAHWGGRCDKLELRWYGDRGSDPNSRYWLQIRSKCDWAKAGGEAVDINCYVTRLWFDDTDRDTENATSSVSSAANNGGSARKEPRI